MTPRVDQRPRRTTCLLAATLLVLGCTDGAGPGKGGRLKILSGGSGNDTIDVRLPEPLVVEARGAPKVEVIFRAFGVGPDSAWRTPVHMWTPVRGWADVVRDTTDLAGRASVNVGLGWASGEGRIVITAPALNAQTTARFTTRPGRPASMVLSPTDTPVVVGRSYQIKANAVDRHGNTLEDAATFARVAGPIEISQNGTVRGAAVGRGEVSIHIGHLVRSAFTSVIPDATIAIRDMGRFVGDTLGFAQVSLDGSRHRWIAPTGVTPTSYSPGNAPAPQWIPGSRQVVYARMVNNEMRLFVGDTTGAARRLIEAPYGVRWEQDPTVSPDGAWIYFDGLETTGAHAIWRVATSGGTPARVTTSAHGIDFRWPSLSPDGNRLAYVTRFAPWQNDFHAYVLDLSTGVATQLSPRRAAGTVWSPTGEWILYTDSFTFGGFPGELRLIRPDGTEDHSIGDGKYYPGGTWSPDGRYVIAVRSDPLPTIMQLIDVTSGVRLPLVYRRSWYGPAWRP